MNWYCLSFLLAVTLINKGKGELLSISSTPPNDTVQITVMQGGGERMKEEGQMKEVWAVWECPMSLELVIPSLGVRHAWMHVWMCHKKPFLTPWRAGHGAQSQGLLLHSMCLLCLLRAAGHVKTYGFFWCKARSLYMSDPKGSWFF